MPSRVLSISMAPSVAFSSLTLSRRVLLFGDRAPELATYICSRAVCRNRLVRFICADNRFDPYAVTRFAKQNKKRPQDALRSILIARAFTAHQLAELVNRLDPATSSQGVTIISGPCSLFFDEDLSIVDAARLFYRMLWRLVELSESGMSLLLAQSSMPADTRRAYFLTDLCRAADVILRYDAVHTFTLEYRGRLALARLKALDRMMGE
jgi:hypothetical protein